MTRQLTLLDTDPVWTLDPATREVGRRGIARARAALAAARTPTLAGAGTPAHDDQQRPAA